MAAPSEQEVRELFIGDTEASSGAITFYAESANDLVERWVPTGNYTSDEVDRATRLVACHMVAATDPTERSETAGDAEADYERPTTTPADLGETRYGRRAIAMIPELGNVGGETSKAEFFGPTGN